MRIWQFATKKRWVPIARRHMKEVDVLQANRDAAHVLTSDVTSNNKPLLLRLSLVCHIGCAPWRSLPCFATSLKTFNRFVLLYMCHQLTVTCFSNATLLARIAVAAETHSSKIILDCCFAAVFSVQSSFCFRRLNETEWREKNAKQQQTQEEQCEATRHLCSGCRSALRITQCRVGFIHLVRSLASCMYWLWHLVWRSLCNSPELMCARIASVTSSYSRCMVVYTVGMCFVCWFSVGDRLIFRIGLKRIFSFFRRVW